MSNESYIWLFPAFLVLMVALSTKKSEHSPSNYSAVMDIVLVTALIFFGSIMTIVTSTSKVFVLCLIGFIISFIVAIFSIFKPKKRKVSYLHLEEDDEYDDERDKKSTHTPPKKHKTPFIPRSQMRSQMKR